MALVYSISLVHLNISKYRGYVMMFEELIQQSNQVLDPGES
jgi:hypothetical protein